MKFPEFVGPFRRTLIREHDSEGFDIGVHYWSANINSPVALSVFIYPIPPDYIDSAAVLDSELAKNELKPPAFDPTARLFAQGSAKIVQSGSTFQGRFTKYTSNRQFAGRFQPVYCTKLLFARGEWFIQYLATYPRNRGHGDIREITLFMKLLKWPETNFDERPDYRDSLSHLIKGNWQHASLEIGGKVFSYSYLEIRKSPDYAKVSKPNLRYEDDPLIILKDVIFYFKSIDKENLKQYCVKGDVCQRLADEDIKEIWRRMGKPDSPWKITHMIDFGGFLFLRGFFKDASTDRNLVDLWTFSREDGEWKLNLSNASYARVKWFAKLVHEDKVKFP